MTRRDSILVASIIATVYFLANWTFNGPAYLADEIGYLNNAAFLGGRFVDGASSYHAGYSLLLAPLFGVLSEPVHVWKGVMAVNAILWGGTFLNLSYMLSRLLPDLSRGRHFSALLVLAVYPANVVMSGYAFSQSAVAFFFSLSLASLLRAAERGSWWMVVHALCTGFVYWVHPSGIAVVVASLAMVLVMSIRSRQYGHLLVHVLVLAGVVASYKLAFEPWRIAGMTAMGSDASLHYPSATKLLRAAADWSYWPRILAVGAGQLSYVIVATLGLAVAGGWTVAVACRDLGRGLVGDPASTRAGALLFMSLSVLAVMGLTAVTAGIHGPQRLDQWVYGRYLDAYLLPLFAVGLCSRWRVRSAVGSALLVWVAGFALIKGVQISGPINWVNMSGFWVAVLDPDPMWWFVVGGVAVAVVSALPRGVVLAILVLLYATSISKQRDWHQSVLQRHSKPSAIVPFLRANAEFDCIAFDRPSTAGFWAASREAERGSLFSFYFFDRQYRKLSASDWRADCDGPLLTYNTTLARTDDVIALAREEATGLLLLVRKEDREQYLQPRPDSRGDTYWLGGGDRSGCVVAGCFEMHARQLARFSQVGELDNGRLRSTGRGGYLFFGPYAKVRAGTYAVEVKGEAGELAGSVLDAVSSRGAHVLGSSGLEAPPGSGGTIGLLRFTAEHDLEDLEIRLRVAASDRVSVESYALKISDGPLTTSTEIERSGAALAGLPRMVGVYRRGALHSDGRAGYLMHGPYLPLPAGRYRLEVTGDAGRSSAARLDVVSAKGRESHLQLAVAPAQPGSAGRLMAEGTFELPTSRTDVEVRAFVPADSDLRITGYRLYRLDSK